MIYKPDYISLKYVFTCLQQKPLKVALFGCSSVAIAQFKSLKPRTYGSSMFFPLAQSLGSITMIGLIIRTLKLFVKWMPVAFPSEWEELKGIVGIAAWC